MTMPSFLILRKKERMNESNNQIKNLTNSKQIHLWWWTYDNNMMMLFSFKIISTIQTKKQSLSKPLISDSCKCLKSSLQIKLAKDSNRRKTKSLKMSLKRSTISFSWKMKMLWTTTMKSNPPSSLKKVIQLFKKIDTLNFIWCSMPKFLDCKEKMKKKIQKKSQKNLCRC